MKDEKTPQPTAENGIEAARHIGGAAAAARKETGAGATVGEGLTADPSKGTAPKDGGEKS